MLLVSLLWLITGNKSIEHCSVLVFSHSKLATSCAIIIILVFNSGVSTCFRAVFIWTNRFHCSILCSTSYYQSNGRLHFGIENSLQLMMLHTHTHQSLPKSKLKTNSDALTKARNSFYSFNYYVFLVNQSESCNDTYSLQSASRNIEAFWGKQRKRRWKTSVCVHVFLSSQDFEDVITCNTWICYMTRHDNCLFAKLVLIIR